MLFGFGCCGFDVKVLCLIEFKKCVCILVMSFDILEDVFFIYIISF